MPDVRVIQLWNGDRQGLAPLTDLLPYSRLNWYIPNQHVEHLLQAHYGSMSTGGN